jgi:branched-chain amino acid aminotransferase
MPDLQSPAYVYQDGELASWESAKVHIDSEAFKRGLSVFEGIKGYWGEGKRFRFVEMKAHYDRLRRSARILYLPFDMDYREFKKGIYTLVGSLINKEKNMWIRPTLYALEGHWGLDTKTKIVFAAFHQEKGPPSSVSMGVSTWRRTIDLSIPPRVKAAPNYQVSRMARIEGRRQGFDDMILLNQHGRVAEATGSCILMVRDGVICTPPATEGALESITVHIVEKIADDLDIPFERRPLERTELAVAEELAVCGTLAEIAYISNFEGRNLDTNRPILSAIRERFFQLVKQKSPTVDIDLSPLPKEYVDVK